MFSPNVRFTYGKSSHFYISDGYGIKGAKVKELKLRNIDIDYSN